MGWLGSNEVSPQRPEAGGSLHSNSATRGRASPRKRDVLRAAGEFCGVARGNEFSRFGPPFPNGGSVFSKDFVVSRQTRDDFVARLCGRKLFLSQRARISKLFVAVSLGESAGASRKPPREFCGLARCRSKHSIGELAASIGSFSMRWEGFAERHFVFVTVGRSGCQAAKPASVEASARRVPAAFVDPPRHGTRERACYFASVARLVARILPHRESGAAAADEAPMHFLFSLARAANLCDRRSIQQVRTTAFIARLVSLEAFCILIVAELANLWDARTQHCPRAAQRLPREEPR